MPGHVTKDNLEGCLKLYPMDTALFYDGICDTCSIQKPARSKHCSHCRACVLRSDHHCFWVNCCIGLRNHRWFILWLISLDVNFCYGLYLTMRVLRVCAW